MKVKEFAMKSREIVSKKKYDPKKEALLNIK